MENVVSRQSQMSSERKSENVAETVPEESAGVNGPGRLVLVMFVATAALIVVVAVAEFILKLLR